MLDTGQMAGDISGKSGIAYGGEGLESIGGRIANESTTTATGMVAGDGRSQAGKGLAGDGVELEQSLGTAIFHGRPVVGIGSPDNVEGVGVVRGGNGCRGRLEFGPKVDDFWT